MVLSRLRCLVLGTLVGAIAGPAWGVTPPPGEDAGEPVAPRVLPLHVALDSLEKREVPWGELVRLTPGEFEQLVADYRERLEVLRQGDEERARRHRRRPATPWVIDSATVRGEVLGEVARLGVTLQLTVHSEETERIPILAEPVAFEAIRLPRAEDRLMVETRKARTFVYVTRGSGARRLELTYLIPIAADRSRRTARVVLPPATLQDTRVRVPAPATGLAVQGPVFAEIESESGGVRNVQVRSSDLGSFTLTWMRHARPVETPPPVATKPVAGDEDGADATPRLTASMQTLFTLADRVLKFHTVVDLKNSRGELAEVKVTFPLGVSVRSVAGADVQGHRPSVEGDRLGVVVRFRKPLRGRTTLDLSGEMALPSPDDGGSTRLALPLAGIPEAFRIQGAVGVAAFSTIQVRPVAESLGDVIQVDPSELGDVIRNRAGTPLLLGFRYTSAAPGIQLDLEKFTTVENLGTVITDLNAVTVLTRGSRREGRENDRPYLQSIHRMVLKVTNARGRHLRVRLPVGATVLACFVDLMPQPPAESAVIGEPDRTELLVALKRSEIVGNKMLPYPVEVAYRLDIEHDLGAMGSLDVPLPRFDAPIVSAAWNVYFPDGYRPYDVAGTFRWLARERDLVLVQYGRDLFEALLSWSFRLLVVALLVGLLVFASRLLRRGRKAEDAPPARASGTLLMTVIVTMMMVGILSAIAVPNFKSARERANVRACYANQKTIAGAVEMFNLDKNMSRRTIDPQFLQELVHEGYLQSAPLDPGQGRSSAVHYHWTDTGNGIACRVHGSIQGY